MQISLEMVLVSTGRRTEGLSRRLAQHKQSKLCEQHTSAGSFYVVGVKLRSIKNIQQGNCI
jgi:hypothetical protein